MSTKAIYLEALVDNATIMSQAAEAMVGLEATYFDRTYGSAGASQITDAEAITAGLSGSAIITSWITLSQQFANFRNSASISPGDYDSTLNQIRSDI